MRERWFRAELERKTLLDYAPLNRVDSRELNDGCPTKGVKEETCRP